MKRTEWYKEAIVYQIYPLSFKDANNDGIGDIEGIISKLDYLKDLGVTAIWFSPLYKSPMADYGYDIADYQDIDPRFGTLDDFKRLLALCHEKGFKVIMDMAINHTSIEHKWFKDAISNTNSLYRDYYIIRKGRKKAKKLVPPTNWDSTFTGSAWERIKGSDEYYLHLFCVEQADLNWENEKVRAEAVSIFNYWLDMGVDGFRLDVFNMFSKKYPLMDAKKSLMGTGSEYFIDGPRIHAYLKELNEKSFSKYDSYTVGESYNPHLEDAKAYADKKNGELDTIFNFAHLDSDNMSKFFKKKFDLLKFKDGLFTPQRENYVSGWNTLVLENHDNSRSNSRFGIDVKKYHYEASTMLPTITFLGFGTPFIYMGEEFGMSNVRFNSIDECKDPVSHFIYKMLTGFFVPKKFVLSCINCGARDMARVPMRWDDSLNHGFNEGCPPWQKEATALVDVNLKKDLENEKSIFRYYQKVIKLKKNDLFIYGEFKELDHNNKRVIAYERILNDEKALVLANFTSKISVYRIPKEYVNGEILLNNYENSEVKETITLYPYESFVIKSSV